MNVSEYSQGICEDGAAILRDGQPMTVEEILDALRDSEKLQAEVELLRETVKRLREISHSLKDDNAIYFSRNLELEQERDQLKAEVERLRALWKKETERAHVAEGELLKSHVRLVTRKQERDQLKTELERLQVAHDDLQIENTRLEQTYGDDYVAIEQERDQLKAAVAMAVDAFKRYEMDVETYPTTEHVSMMRNLGGVFATHDAEVIERLIADCAGPHEGFNLPSKQWLQDYANQLRQQAKEVTSDPDS